MTRIKTISLLVFAIALIASVAAALGVFSQYGPGPYDFTSIHGKTVGIYGKGIYQHMSAQVAPQGIAQDYVTLFIAVPGLIISLILAARGSLRGRFVLAGILGYFLVTYLFYLVMGAFSALFLVYAFLMGASFFAFSLVMFSFDRSSLPNQFGSKAPTRFSGTFLVGNAGLVAMLWLSVVVPPLLNGTIYPDSLEHYTTLIVQGMDLGLLLPLSVLSGVLLLRRTTLGYLLGPVYLIFLSLLMTALVAKIVGMGLLGYRIIPAIFIIPVLQSVSVVCSVLLLRSIQQQRPQAH